MKYLRELLELVDGYKTYCAIFVGLIGIVLWAVGILPEEAFRLWMAVCGLGTLVGFRSALK